MATSRSFPVRASFDRLQVDLSSGVLRKSDGVSVRIQQQPLQVLRLVTEIILARDMWYCSMNKRVGSPSTLVRSAQRLASTLQQSAES